MNTGVDLPDPHLAQDVQDALHWSYVRTLLYVIDKTKVNHLCLLQKINSKAMIDLNFLLQPTSDLNASASDRNVHNEVCLIPFDLFS